MADFGATTVTATELKGSAGITNRHGSVFNRNFSFNIPSAAAVAAAPLSGISIAPGTLVLGATFGVSTAGGITSTLAFKTTTANKTFAAAQTYNQTAGTTAVLALTAAAALICPPEATANDTITVTLAGAAAPTVAGGTNVNVTLVCAAVGNNNPAPYTTFTGY